MKTVTAYALRLGDNGLVLSQRLGARSWRSISRWPISVLI